MSGKKNIKILLAYHKPDRLVKNDILVPIHVGRDIAFEKSKDGKISTKDYEWLVKNCIGDNTGDNISSQNRYFCELTATYWVWKNYDKLGNPDYIGLMHYRTFFDLYDYAKQNGISTGLKDFGYNQEFLQDILDKYDGVISKKLNTIKDFEPSWSFDDSNKSFWHLSDSNYKKLYNVFLQYDNEIHFKNMFILKREDFFEYCETIFPLLFDLLRKYPNEESISGERSIGRHAECLSSLFFMYLYKTKQRKILELPWLIVHKKKFNLLNLIKEQGYACLFKVSKNKKFLDKYFKYKYKNN